MARRATLIKQERAGKRPLLVLDAGNSLTGDRNPASASLGATSVAALNRMGYDAVALGPMDLALGPAVLRLRLAEASFAVLSANATDPATGQLIAVPYVIREIGGYRIAIAGLTGQDAAGGLSVRDPVTTAEAVVSEVRPLADIVILLSNCGSVTNQQIADRVTGISVIIGGGSGPSGKPWVSNVTGTPLFHADQASPGHAGRVVGIARLQFGADGTRMDHDWRSMPLTPDIADDAEMASWVQQQSQ